MGLYGLSLGLGALAGWWVLLLVFAMPLIMFSLLMALDVGVPPSEQYPPGEAWLLAVLWPLMLVIWFWAVWSGVMDEGGGGS